MSATDRIEHQAPSRRLIFACFVSLLLFAGELSGQGIVSESHARRPSYPLVGGDSIVRVLVKNSHTGLVHEDELISQSTVVTVSEFNGVVFDARGYVLAFVGSRWPEVEQPGARFAVEQFDGSRVSAELIGVDERISVAVLQSAALENRGIVLNSSLTHRVVDLISWYEGRWGKSCLHLRELARQGRGPEAEIRGRVCESEPAEFARDGSLAFDEAGRFLGMITRVAEAGLTKSLNAFQLLPVSILKSSFKQVTQEGGNVRSGWLGVVLESDSDKIWLERILEGTPADQAGLRPGDVVLAANGAPVKSQLEVAKAIRWTGPGKILDLTIQREGRATKVYPKLTVPPEERRPVMAWAVEIPRVWKGSEVEPRKDVRIFPVVMPSLLNLGLSVTAMTPQLAAIFKSPKEGLLVKSVKEESPAARVGFQAGDILLSINKLTLAAESDLKKALQSTQDGALQVKYFRQGKVQVKRVLLQ